MATWTTIPNLALQPGAPVRSLDGLALRDNPVAIAEGASGAPRIETDALDVDAVLEATGRDYTFGAVGTHALLWKNTTATVITAGSTHAGSTLRPAGLSGTIGITDSTGVYQDTRNALLSVGVPTTVSTVTGTWLALGSTNTSTSGVDYPVTLFVRVL